MAVKHNPKDKMLAVYMLMTWLSYLEVGGMVVEMQAKRLPSQCLQFKTGF